jgi:hypothetical protein
MRAARVLERDDGRAAAVRARRAALGNGEQEGGMRWCTLVDDHGHRRTGQRRAIDHCVKLRRVATTRHLAGVAVVIGQRRTGPDVVVPHPHVREHMPYGRVLQQEKGEDEGGQEPVTQSRHQLKSIGQAPDGFLVE